MFFACKLSNARRMIQFQCDYNEGAHERIMQRLMQTNLEQTVGYGEDAYCQEARQLIRKACGNAEADVHFLVGGTQTNTTVIAALLRPYQGVLCATTGHINVHETGAIEHTGHKVLALPGKDGKLSAQQIEAAVVAHRNEDGPEHMVQPGMVYISFPTEVGTLYSKQELSDIYATCRRYDLPLFIDGARLGYGLTSDACDLSLTELAALCDVFYIGGTKVGALFGEAVVFKRQQPHFRYHIKQQGGMLAKGRLLGIQFQELFTDNLYFYIARQANVLAQDIKRAFQRKGIKFLIDSPTNQQFPILTDQQKALLGQHFLFSEWANVGEGLSAVRFCTSWATRPEAVAELVKVIESL